MKTIRLAVLIAMLFALLMTPVQAQSGTARDLGREVLASNDGWASEGAGVTGGSAADATHIYIVTNRSELVTALNYGTSAQRDLPKIIYVSGTIDANVDDNNQPLTCVDYYRNGFTWEAFLATYDPAVWGKVPPTGPLEAARLVSRDAQQARVRIRVGSNTTIVGLGKDAVILGGWLDLRGTSSVNATNIIIRNITFEDTYDCFPAWAPTDGTLGAWNALYDSISLRYTNHVWIDHNTFLDRTTLDSLAPQYFGVLFQQHDGLLDITNESDLVTVSWNRFEDHDKVMLISGSDSNTTDRGKLRITLHHNLFQNTGQRTPRVRFGKVHIYNNYYKQINNPTYVYAWGVGKESMIYAENNYFTTDQKLAPEAVIAVYTGTMIHATGTMMNGTPGGGVVDVVAAFNAAYDPDLATDVGWTPTRFLKIDSTKMTVPLVESRAGPMNW